MLSADFDLNKRAFQGILGHYPIRGRGLLDDRIIVTLSHYTLGPIPANVQGLMSARTRHLMADERNEPAGFKVVDRRSFTAEGSPREESSPGTRPVESPPTERVSRPQIIEPPDTEPSGEPSGFETLVSYLSTTTMFQLGLIPGPGGERIPADMPNAQRTIDLLEVLQEKTHGNLTPNESRLLDDVLYELRMTFVELQKRQARKGK